MIWLNGDFRSEGKISINDRGFLLGDGIFETILVDRGHAFFLDAHLDRLRIGLATIKIDWRIDEKAIAGIIGELFSVNKISGLGAVRLTISRGPGPRGLRMRGAVSSTSLLTISEFNPPKASPADLIITEAIRPCDSIASRHKLTHYTDNILAIGEAEAAGADEAVMMNRFGRVACAAASNVFVIFGDGDVVTPPVEEGALPGIVRDKLIGMPSQFVVERPV
ncbi:MAG: aminotransferase class IV, partial [Pseudomonadota bacterium]